MDPAMVRGIPASKRSNEPVILRGDRRPGLPVVAIDPV
jgi:hypothetical protein